MSEFACSVVRITIEPHPNADAIEIARVGDFQSIVKKGQFLDGELGVYIPEQAVLPVWLLKEMGFWSDIKNKGSLSGSAGDRVKAIKLRGVLSQGLMYPAFSDFPDGLPYGQCVVYGEEEGEAFFNEGDDVSAHIGIVKYEPKLPSHMTGKIAGVDLNATLKYDFENIKKTPDLFEDGELVVITEKIHGTLMQVGVVPSHMANERYYKGRVIVTSKGQGAKGYILDYTDETNLYIQTAMKHGLMDKMLDTFGEVADENNRPFFLVGEVYGVTPSGKGVQDLTYNGDQLGFAAFDLCAGTRGDEAYAPHTFFKHHCEEMGVPMVPVLYIGPYSKKTVLEHIDGATTIGNTGQIREGVVVKTRLNDNHPSYGRKIAKSISEAYLLRKGEVTEFN